VGRLHYDWSDPSRVVLKTTDSNVWSDDSSWTYSLSPEPDGTTRVDVVAVREGKNLKGRVLALALDAGGKHLLESGSARPSRRSTPAATTPKVAQIVPL
jgi:hypothetical protein